MCLVGFSAFGASLRFDTALRANGDIMALSHMILLSFFKVYRRTLIIDLVKRNVHVPCLF